MLNVALFGFTAKQWREANSDLVKGGKNIRDYATINELTVLSNLETHNAELIKIGQNKTDRFEKLLDIATYQLRVLNEADQMKKLSITE